jgi:hypothetical protein
VIGNSATITARYLATGQSLGNARLVTQQGTSQLDIQFSDFDSLNINNFVSLEIDGLLDIDDEALTVSGPTPVNLGVLTTLAGGSITAQGPVTLAIGRTLRGFGVVNARIAAELGSTIQATGGLTLGDPNSTTGFATRGELRVGGNTVTLLDANQAVLGSVTRLGIPGSPGTLVAANGAVVDFGNNVLGFGTIQTPNDVLKPLLNNGVIQGNSAAEKVALAGHIRGVGSLDNVITTGTNSPGFSPAKVYYGSASVGPAGTLITEVGGTTPGSGHDQFILSGLAELGGTLDVQLINGFEPEVGQTFTVLSAAGGISGEFDAASLPGLPTYWQWQLAYGANDVRLSVFTTRPWHNSQLPFDVSDDTHSEPDDALTVINFLNAFGSLAVPANAVYGPIFYDVTGDNFVAPDDALSVINAINAGLGGEAESAASQSEFPTDLIDLLAIDIASQSKRRRS